MGRESRAKVETVRRKPSEDDRGTRATDGPSSPLSHSHPTHRVAVDLVERKKDGNGESMKGEGKEGRPRTPRTVRS